jgi:ferritin-like metal-binding protein YciE
MRRLLPGRNRWSIYEISAYGTLHSYAIHLGHDQAAKLLQTTLDEEREADQKLTEIAMNRVNVEAARAA